MNAIPVGIQPFDPHDFLPGNNILIGVVSGRCFLVIAAALDDESDGLIVSAFLR